MTGDEGLELAASDIADGRDVNWAAVRDSGADPEALRYLEAIADIARLHQDLQRGQDAEVPDLSAFASVEASSASSGPPVPDEASASESGGTPWGSLIVHEKLGSGSFADVYRAWDPRLRREVALKLIRPNADVRSDTVAREGQLLARIDHPNVMAVYGTRAVDGRVGIWGELLRGRTLAQIVADDGPLSAHETLVVTDAVCRALAAAHNAGLLHRDVKAQNVMRTRGGRIVLTDFGLGRARDEASGEALAGTPLYLAPELFADGTASVRSDVYSLGVLMFYLVTGAFPVTGETVADIRRHHQLGVRAALEDLRPDLPASFIQVVSRALCPQPADRFPSAGVMQAAVLAAGAIATQPAEPRPGAALRRATVAALALGATALVASIATPRLGLRWGTPPDSVARRVLSIDPPPESRFGDSSWTTPALSPNGQHVAIPSINAATGRTHLWIHSLATGSATRLPHTERASLPFWTPDSRTVAFFESGGLIRAMTLEGAPVGQVATATEPRGASVNAAGTLIYPKGPRSGLFVGGWRPGTTERRLVPLDTGRGEMGYMWPQFLPDGERFIYFVLSNERAVRGIYLASLSAPRGRKLVDADTSGIVAGTHLLYVKNGELLAQRLLADMSGPAGSPVKLAGGVAVNFDHKGVVDALADGTVAYMEAAEHTELTWMTPSGQRADVLPLPPGRYRSPAISRDGRWLAVQQYRDGLSEIQIFSLENPNVRRRPVVESVEAQYAVWGPGHMLAYTLAGPGIDRIVRRDLSGDARDVEVPLADPELAAADLMPTDWTPDGRHLLVVASSQQRPFSVWRVAVDGGRASPIQAGPGTQISGRISPDGRRVLYLRRGVPRDTDQPERELFSCDFPDCKTQTLLATAAVDPSWQPGGRISFLHRNGIFSILKLSPTSVPIGVPYSFGTDVQSPEAARNNYAWTPDTSKLLVNLPARADGQRRIRLMLGGLPSATGSRD